MVGKVLCDRTNAAKKTNLTFCMQEICPDFHICTLNRKVSYAAGLMEEYQRID